MDGSLEDIANTPPSPAPAEPPADHPLLADLTDAQRSAVVCTEGPLLVLAAAGSGKTRVITRRIAWLVREVGMAPWQVLAITFTNKAAGEMGERIAQLLSARQARAATICTFHSLCARLLREFAEQVNLPPGYSIYDTADQKRAIKDAMKVLDISPKNFAPEAIRSAISKAKNELTDERAFTADAGDFFARTVAKVYQKYQQMLRANNAVDFDDLLLLTANLLRRNEAVRTELQDRYQYLLIDEYQDTNHAQFVIANMLSASHRNICVVGDPDQSIYGWRGANLRNILEFEQRYAEARVIQLGENFRSTPQILQAADHLIRHNKQRKHKPLFTSQPGGRKLTCFHAADEEHEADLAVGWLKELHEQDLRWADMAIFYRVNALTRALEESLMKSSVPYQVVRGTAFYQRKEIKDALAYLKVLSNPADEVSLLRIINTPGRGIGDTSVQHLQAFAAAQSMTLFEALGDPRREGVVRGRAAPATGKFSVMYQTWRNKLDQDGDDLMFEPSVRDVVEMIIRDSGLEAMYKDGKDADEDKLANLYELITAAQRFDEEYGEENRTLAQRVGDYLEQVSLVSDVDAMEDDAGAVTLMTLHAAKGLEFPAVAIVGLEEGLLPHSRAFENPEELEEERRLCFVGITRARQRLLLTHARYRAMRGYRERTIASQFLRELPKNCLEITDLSGAGGMFEDELARPTPRFRPAARDRGPTTRRSAQPHHSGLQEGLRVRHPQFGVGTVVSVGGAGPNARAKVQFQRVGVKTLVLEYARLEIMR